MSASVNQTRTRSSKRKTRRAMRKTFPNTEKTPQPSNIELYSLYLSGGRTTRGQICKIKQILSEDSTPQPLSDINAKARLLKKSSKNQNNNSIPLVIDSLVPLTSAISSIQEKEQNTVREKIKRKREATSDIGQSPDRKRCKRSTGSVVSARTAVLPSASSSQNRPVTRSTLASRRLRSSLNEDEPRASSPCFKASGALTAPSTPTKLTSTSPEGSAEWLNRFMSWNAPEKFSALEKLISWCQPHEVRRMLEMIEPKFQRDFISLLPKELSLHILTFLDPHDLMAAAQTCKYWRILAEDNLMWKEKCIEEGIVERHSVKSMKNPSRPKKCSHKSGRANWKATYLRQVRIEANWRIGSNKPSKILKGHDDHVITCLQFNGSRIVSGSDDNTLKVWSAVSGKCLRTLTGHTGGVWASQMRNNLIISGSTDRTLKIWNADTGDCVHTLFGHTSTVRCLALHGNIVVSGSRDATLRVWNIGTGACQHILTGHMAAVRCVCYDGTKVVSGAYDFMVKVWDPNTEECLHTLQGHTNRVYSLQFDGQYVASGSLDTSIRVWELESGTCMHTLMGHQSLTSGMELKDNILVSGNADSTVKIWDIKTGECLKTLEGPNKHLSAVTSLQFHGRFVVTSSDDGTVKLWDIKTGKVIRDLVTLDSRGSGGVVWRIRASRTKLVCAVGSRNGTEETKLLVLDFNVSAK